MLLEGCLSPQKQHAIERQYERQPPHALFLAAVSNTTQTPSCVCQLAMLLKGYLFPQTRYKHRCVRQLGMLLKVDFSPKHDTNTKLCMPVGMLWRGYLSPQTRHEHQAVYASWYAMEGVCFLSPPTRHKHQAVYASWVCYGRCVFFISPDTTRTPSCVCQLGMLLKGHLLAQTRYKHQTMYDSWVCY